MRIQELAEQIINEHQVKLNKLKEDLNRYYNEQNKRYCN